MKDTFIDANFPRTMDGRVYHLGLRAGEVANRIITVGSPSRADKIADLLDGPSASLFRLSSERGFLTMTGRYNGVPVSIISIGMGYPNMDFFVREVRECVSGDLIIVRLGSCGGLRDLPVGSLVVPITSVSIRRNYDYDFLAGEELVSQELPYHISRPVLADPELHAALARTLSVSQSENAARVVTDTVNASADSFYSSQGRKTSFADCNDDLIDRAVATIPNLASLEMETFHLFHLASVWRPRPYSQAGNAPTNDRNEDKPHLTLPPTNLPVSPALGPAPSGQSPSAALPAPRIRAAAVQMIFANRRSQDFITPERVEQLEAWSGRAVLDALCAFYVPSENLHEDPGSVWESVN